VNPHDEHVLVVAAVENHDLTPPRDLLVDAPQVVAGQLRRRRRLERYDADPLGIHPLEDAADDAVLARGVHALEDDEQAVAPLGVEHLLQLHQVVAQLVQPLLGFRLAVLEAPLVGGIPVGEPYPLPRLDPVSVHVASFSRPGTAGRR